ncbi:scavenger receptor class F member 2-like [Haliotis rubra]|uniref:scavenger receptor class F member 2-like n=1 Tax=Haliotis rubra TaxID=36100 RepID=UPI001EE55B9B|nr:scavenger receptor class F member 2-like [Haliotis rubra]
MCVTTSAASVQVESVCQAFKQKGVTQLVSMAVMEQTAIRSVQTGIAKGDNSSCDRSTGECVGGCKAGWNGIDCTQKCVFTYGDNCARLCSARNCSGTSSSSCDHVTGKCDGGCKPGWKGNDCRTVCTQGLEYGADCVGNCCARMCEGGSGICPKDTGRCDSGCESGVAG